MPSRLPRSAPLSLPLILLVATVLVAGCQSAPDRTDTDSASQSAVERPYVQAESAIEAGRYLTIVGGCNDCHTEGYLQSEGKIPEEDWLMGSRLGWQGPWGTTYPTNLRLRVQEMSEEAWVNQLHNRHANPPMPWMNVNQMSARDARALYRYIQSLGAKGDTVPDFVPPAEEPKTPYISLTPQNLPASKESGP